MKTIVRHCATLTALVLFSFFTSAQTITTLTTGMGMPWNLATDGSGFIYAAGYSDNKVYKINSSTGVKTVIAGTGVNYYSGDGGLATLAELNAPAGVAVDAAGNVYIADAGNFCIRKITVATGIITTVAGTPTQQGFSGDGGPATSALLSATMAVAMDASNNIYISDFDNNRVRKVNASDGRIHTIAGTGLSSPIGDGNLATNASLLTPMGLAFDASGNLYIADMDHHRIRKLTMATGRISTVAGNGTGAFGGDGGPATAASLQYPTMAAVDGSGNIYIADQFNNRVRKVTASTGFMSTIAGNGATEDAGDGGPATASQIHSPSGIALSGGTLYVSATGIGSVRKIAHAYSALPVVLVSFTAMKKENEVLLKWSTGEEKNNALFEVEHSTNGSDWKKIGTVLAAGQTAHSYSFTHTSPTPANQYRLKQVDKDQNHSYSSIVKVTFEGAGNALQLAQNPIRGNRITFTKGVEGTVHYKIVSLSGAMLQSGTLSGGSTMELGNCTPGQYLILLSTGQTIPFQKR